jgi:primase-polymerase (primpol)-like protein
MDRTCDYCGTRINMLRAGARFCSPKCRVYASRDAKRGPLLPRELTERTRWVRWKHVARRGGWAKMPIRLDGAAASSTDAGSWSSFDDVRLSTLGSGFGFVLDGDGIGCIDLDHCISADGEVAAWARCVLEANPGTYVEVSQSGLGLHVFGWLKAGPGSVTRDAVQGNVEVYSRGRYIAVTGRLFEGSPLTLGHLTTV